VGFQAAAAAVPITPQFPVELAGYGPYLDRWSQGVHDELWARSVVIRLEETTLALVSCDVIAIPQCLIERVETRVRAAYPGAHVVLAATHTHSGPATIRMIGWGEPHHAYLAVLEQQIGDVILRAASHLTPATLRYAAGHLDGVAYNREREGGAVDSTVHTLWIEGSAGEPLAVVYGFGCHAVVLRDDNRLISADFPGVASEDIAKHLGSQCQALFLQTPCGDVDPIPPTQSFDVVTRYGKALAEAVLALRPQASSLAPRLAIHREPLSLPVSAPDRTHLQRLREGDPEALAAETAARISHLDLNYGAAQRATASHIRERWQRFFQESAGVMTPSDAPVRAPVVGVRIGALKLLALPWEMYVELGLALRHGQPAIWPVTCAQGCFGYIPDALAYDRAEYSVVLVPFIAGRPPFQRDIGSLVVGRLMAMLEGL